MSKWVACLFRLRCSSLELVKPSKKTELLHHTLSCPSMHIQAAVRDFFLSCRDQILSGEGEVV
eukprot:353182-Chlamydomonas_euryale.AAC.38